MSKDKRGTNPKSLDNLVKGRVKGIKRRTNNAEGGQYNTWRDILSAIGSLDLTEMQWTQLSGVGITKEWATSKGITAYRKLYAAFLAYLNAPESPALLRDIMEREEGKVPTPVELRDWREAARRDGMNPDEVENEIERIIAAKMVGRSDSGCMAAGGTGEAGGEGESANPNQ